MVEISHRERVVRAKIIYYGPAAGGKTTNILVLHRRADPRRRGEMVSVNSAQDRTILLDLLPVKTPAFRGYELRFQVIAVPGQPMYAASRKLLLNGADAVVFVANSATDRWVDTIQSLQEMNQNLIAHGLDPATMPVVFQYNKRDLPDVTQFEAMEKTLNARKTKSFSAVAVQEEGVLETFSAALSLTLRDLTDRYNLGDQMPDTQSVDQWVEDSMKAIFERREPDAPDEGSGRQAHDKPVDLGRSQPATESAVSPNHTVMAGAQEFGSSASAVATVEQSHAESSATVMASSESTEPTSERAGEALADLIEADDSENTDQDPSEPHIEIIEPDDEEAPSLDSDFEEQQTDHAPSVSTSTVRASHRPPLPSTPPKPESQRVIVTVPVASEVSGSPSAATPATDPAVEHSLVESYALAAANLTTALEELRDQKDALERRLEELSAPIDTAQELLMGAPSHQVLKRGLLRIGSGLGSDVCSLALMRPDGRLEPVLLNRLEVDPLFFTLDEQGRPLATWLLEQASPVIYVHGDDGPLADALKRAGDRFLSMVAIPVTSQVRPLGLLTFYLPPDVSPPHEGAITHLSRLGQGIALAIELVSGALASERLQTMEKNATMGQISEKALLEMGAPVDRMFAHMGRIRSREGAPPWLADDVRTVVAELSRAKQFRDGVLGFMAGHVSTIEPIGLSSVFDDVRVACRDDLQRNKIRLDLESPEADVTVNADAFLLRCALTALVEESQSELSGCDGGIIRLSASIDEDKVNIRVSDNISSVKSGQSGESLPNYLSWALDRKVKGWRSNLVKNLAEYFDGKSLAKQNNEGNEVTLILPLAKD